MDQRFTSLFEVLSLRWYLGVASPRSRLRLLELRSLVDFKLSYSVSNLSIREVREVIVLGREGGRDGGQYNPSGVSAPHKACCSSCVDMVALSSVSFSMALVAWDRDFFSSWLKDFKLLSCSRGWCEVRGRDEVRPHIPPSW